MQHLFFNKINSELKAYLLGFYVGDGSIHSRKTRKEYSIRFSQSIQDPYIINLILDSIGKVNILTTKAKIGKIRNKEFKSKPQNIIIYYSKQMVIDLISLGYGYKKTYRNIHLPTYLNKANLIHFIRGYFDADGTCNTYISVRKDRPIGNRVKPTFHITSNSYNILKELQIFLKDLNIRIPLYYINNYWVLKSGSTKEIRKLYKLLYENSNYFIPSKEEKFKKVMLTSSEFRELKNSRPCNA